MKKRFFDYFYTVINFCVFIIISPLDGATISVTNNNDSGSGSLRQALLDANNSDTITVNAGIGAIQLTSPIPLITKDITINVVSGAHLTQKKRLSANF